MKKYIWCAFVLSLACCLPLTAGGLYHFRGNAAVAEFESWDNAGVVTVVWMQVEQYRSQNPPGNGTELANIFFEAFRYDTVNDVVLFDGYGSQALPPGIFEIDGKLNQATLAGQLEFLDAVSGNPLTFSINLTVNAVGPAVRQTDHEHLNGPTFKVNYRWTGVGREAEGVGTVFLGAENLTPDPTYYGRLMSAKSMQVVVE